MFELQTYLLLHTLTFFSTVFGILLSFKYYNAQNIYLMSSTLLHLFLCYPSLKAPSRINQTLFNRLIMNYSFHFILMNILFYFVGVPLSWGVAILLVSFYRLVEYLSTYMFRGATDGIGKTINDIYLKLTNPPLALSTLTCMEVMTLFMTPRHLPFGLLVIKYYIYLFGFVLYRYATDNFHQQFWTQTKLKITSLINKLPIQISNPLLTFIGTFAKMGNIAKNIYRVRVTPVNNNNNN